jgi:hypothetical protein
MPKPKPIMVKVPLKWMKDYKKFYEWYTNPKRDEINPPQPPPPPPR